MDIEQIKKQFRQADVGDEIDVNNCEKVWNFIQKALKETRKETYEQGYDVGYLDGKKEFEKDL